MNTRKVADLLLAAGTGACAGYLAACGLTLLRELRTPTTAVSHDRHRYVRLRRSLELVETVRSTAVLLVLVYAPATGRLDRATLRLPLWLRPAALAAILALVTSLVDLPIAFVHDLTLERRYGLTERSNRDWAIEMAKSSALAIGMIGALAALLGAAMRRAPRAWPLYAALGALPLSILGNLIAPLYILPLFNTFEPLGGELEMRLRALAQRFGVGQAEILRMDMSRQTRKANAFVIGVGNAHRIVVGDTLLGAFTDDEIAFVVAHELGHYVNRDVWRSIAVGSLFAGALFFLADAGSDERAGRRSSDRPLGVARVYARMLLWGLALRPMLLVHSRAREWAADRFALAATGDPRAGAAAFSRLRELNLADDDPPRWYELLFASHPSLRSRIAALESRCDPEPSRSP